jgi:hypothetical protein
MLHAKNSYAPAGKSRRLFAAVIVRTGHSGPVRLRGPVRGLALRLT